MEEIAKSCGDRPDKVHRTLDYVGTHGGGAKSGESSTVPQGTDKTYNKAVSRKIDGVWVKVPCGYDATARILTACNVPFKMSVVRVAMCPEPVDLGRENDACVAFFRMLKEAFLMDLLGGTWMRGDDMPLATLSVCSLNQWKGRGKNHAGWSGRAVGSKNSSTATYKVKSENTGELRAAHVKSDAQVSNLIFHFRLLKVLFVCLQIEKETDRRTADVEEKASKKRKRTADTEAEVEAKKLVKIAAAVAFIVVKDEAIQKLQSDLKSSLDEATVSDLRKQIKHLQSSRGKKKMWLAMGSEKFNRKISKAPSNSAAARLTAQQKFTERKKTNVSR